MPPAMKLKVVTEARQLEVRQTEDAVAARAAAGQRVPKPMNSPPTNIQASLPAGPSAERSIEHAERPRRRPAAAKRREDRKPPRTRPTSNGSRHPRPSMTALAPEIWLREDQAADVLEPGRDAEPPVEANNTTPV